MFYCNHLFNQLFRPIIDYDEALEIRREIYNATSEITVTLAVIDEGVPPRGSAINVTVNISNTCLLNEQFEKTNFTFSVNKTSGEFYLRVPGYWTVKFGKYIVFYVQEKKVKDDIFVIACLSCK